MHDAVSVSNFVGSKFYVSPEIYKGRKYDYKTDIWSSMISLYILFIGDMPFYSDKSKLIRDRVITHDFAGEFDGSMDQWKFISPEARDFMQRGF